MKMGIRAGKGRGRVGVENLNEGGGGGFRTECRLVFLPKNFVRLFTN